MTREYVSWYSPALRRNMEMLVFGTGGASVLFFPPRMGRFYDYENWRVIETLRSKIVNGYIQVFCVDSNDLQSFYNTLDHPAQKILNHIDYECYIMNEVVPFVQEKNPGAFRITAGCSLGAFHALNFALKYPGHFDKVVGMSGRYDLTAKIGHYDDLFSGYHDENIYYSTPAQYMKNLEDEKILSRVRAQEIVLVIGREDVLFENNRQMHHVLLGKKVQSTLHIWDHEVHHARSWRQMVSIYL
jgi:esterase/lipase superfamily enzyme